MCATTPSRMQAKTTRRAGGRTFRSVATTATSPSGSSCATIKAGRSITTTTRPSSTRHCCPLWSTPPAANGSPARGHGAMLMRRITTRKTEARKRGGADGKRIGQSWATRSSCLRSSTRCSMENTSLCHPPLDGLSSPLATRSGRSSMISKSRPFTGSFSRRWS